MELLGDMGHVESRFGPFRDSVSVGARYERGLRQTYHRLRNHFGTFCVERTTGSKIMSDAPDGTTR
jgi:hypothetical protein